MSPIRDSYRANRDAEGGQRSTRLLLLGMFDTLSIQLLQAAVAAVETLVEFSRVLGGFPTQVNDALMQRLLTLLQVSLDLASVSESKVAFVASHRRPIASAL